MGSHSRETGKRAAERLYIYKLLLQIEDGSRLERRAVCVHVVTRAGENDHRPGHQGVVRGMVG
jgi:hypothetical protein